MALRMGVATAEVSAWETGAQAPNSLQTEVIESLFRRSEASVLEIQEVPHAENLLDEGHLGSVNLRDLVRDKTEDSSV